MHRQLRADAIEGAAEIFVLNTRRFPDSANVWDSLAEAYMERGDRERAIQHYRRSLELDPNNDNARERLEAHMTQFPENVFYLPQDGIDRYIA